MPQLAENMRKHYKVAKKAEKQATKKAGKGKIVSGHRTVYVCV